jgi:hypothetical protein
MPCKLCVPYVGIVILLSIPSIVEAQSFVEILLALVFYSAWPQLLLMALLGLMI